MYLFNFYVDESQNLRNILIGEIDRADMLKYNININNIGDDIILEMLDKPDGPMKIYHDIRRIRNGNIVSVFDNETLLISMEYKEDGGYLKKAIGKERLLFNKEKIRMVKFNKSGSITCSFGGEDKTYDNKESAIHTTSKKNNKPKTIRTPFNTPDAINTINVAIKELLKDMDNSMRYIQSKYIKFFPDNKYQTVSYIIDSDKENFNKLLATVLKAAEKYTIFLNFNFRKDN